MTQILSSRTSPLRIGSVFEQAGHVGITFCPGKQGYSANRKVLWKRDIEEDVAVLKAWGAHHVVTLLEPHEFEMLGVARLPQAIEDLGMQWHHLPITDGGIPDARALTIWNDLRHELATRVWEGENVVVHCRGGLGRAGMITTSLLSTLLPHIPTDLLICHVRNVRPGAIETQEQERWVSSYQGSVDQTHPQYSAVVEQYIRDCLMFRKRAASAPDAFDQTLEHLEDHWDRLRPEQQSQTQRLLSQFKW